MLTADVVVLGRALPSPEADIAKITGRIKIGNNPDREFRTASAGENFMGGVFGRDLAKMMQHEIENNPSFVRDGLLLLASLQGTTFNEKSEEEPGKILHEMRTTELPDAVLPAHTRKLIASLGPLFGGDENGFISYVSADSTGEFLKTAFLYIEARKKDPQANEELSILDEIVYDKDGKAKTFRDCMMLASNWISDTTTYGPLHFNREKKPKTTEPFLFGWHSISGNFINQQLRDSGEANHFPNGELVNPNGTQYETGMQAVAHDTLLAMSEMFPSHPQSFYWRETARKLQIDSIAYLFNPETSFFAMGADTDPVTGNLRRVDTDNISVADMLGSQLLREGVSRKDFITIISTHMRNFFSENFWTPYGVRTESLLNWYLFDSQAENGEPTIHSPYHGPSSVWDELNGVLADVQISLNLPRLAHIVDDAVYNANALIGCHSELKHVGQHNELGVDPKGLWAKIKPRWSIHTTNIPDFTQGWSITNEVAAARRRRTVNTLQTGSWQDMLQEEIIANLIMRGMLPVRLETPEQVEQARSLIEPLALDTASGEFVQRLYFQRHGALRPAATIINPPSVA